MLQFDLSALSVFFIHSYVYVPPRQDRKPLVSQHVDRRRFEDVRAAFSRGSLTRSVCTQECLIWLGRHPTQTKTYHTKHSKAAWRVAAICSMSSLQMPEQEVLYEWLCQRRSTKEGPPCD